MLIASATPLPRTKSTTSLAFRRYAKVAKLGFHTHLPLLSLLIRSVPSEVTSRRKLTQLVTNHVLGHENRNETFPIVNRKSMTHELWNNC